RGPLDTDAFRRAWHEVLARHPVLRTAFAWQELDRPLQVVWEDAELPWAEHDWRDRAREEQQSRWQEHLAEDRRRGLALDRPPLLRLALFRLADDAYRFLWTYHHLLLDGWSLPLVLGEALACYHALRAGQTAPWQPARP